MVRGKFTLEFFPDIWLFPGLPGVFQAFVAAGVIFGNNDIATAVTMAAAPATVAAFV